MAEANEKMREDFEAWECDSDHGPQTDQVWLMYDAKTNTYPLDKIQARWVTWQASRAALVIELPNRFAEKYQDYYDDVEGGCFNEARYINDLTAAIVAAGVKCK